MQNSNKLSQFMLSLTLLLFPAQSFSQGLVEAASTVAAIKDVLIKKDNKEETQGANEKNKVKEAIIDVLLGNKAESLMFSEEEDSNINRAVKSLSAGTSFSAEEYEGDYDSELAEEELLKLEEEERNKNVKSSIYLASILYVNKNEWIVWLNDKKIFAAKNNSKNEFFVKSINKGSVTISWKIGLTKWRIISRSQPGDPTPETNDENKVEVSFTLRPNQTFLLLSDEIIEGRP